MVCHEHYDCRECDKDYNQIVAKARKDALEEAAKEADERGRLSSNSDHAFGYFDAANHIRALKEKK